MKIILSPRAEKELKKISKINQIALARKIRLLKDASSQEEEKLKGYPNIFRMRIGDYRLVYKKTSQEIYIILIGHRKDSYDLVRRLF